MSTFPRKDYPVKWIPVGMISVVWIESQRPLNEWSVKKIADDFDPDAFGVITVSQPDKKGVHHCIDGQTRKTAVERLWGDKEMVPCLMLPTKDPAEAAEIWLKMNTGRNKPDALPSFLVAVTAGRETETATNKIIHQAGYKLGMEKADGTISAVSACLQVYRKHGEDVLADTFRTIQATWGRSRDSVQGAFIQGFAELVAKHNGALDRKRLAERIAKKYTPARFLGAARQARDFNGGSMATGVAGVLVKTYNVGLAAEKRLPE